MSDRGDLKEKLQKYPNLKVVSSTAKYLRIKLADQKKTQVHYVIDFCDESVTMHVHSSVEPLYFLNESITHLLDLRLLLDKTYSIELEGIMPLINEALHAQKLELYLDQFKMNRHIHNGDITLSKRVISLLRQNAQLEKRLRENASNTNDLLMKFIITKFSYHGSIEAVKSDTKFSSDEILAALNGLPNIGYKAVFLSKSSFNVIAYA